LNFESSSDFKLIKFQETITPRYVVVKVSEEKDAIKCSPLSCSLISTPSMLEVTNKEDDVLRNSISVTTITSLPVEVRKLNLNQVVIMN